MTEIEFSPVDNELPLRWFRRLHLVPANGLGIFRRAVFFALLTWVPIAAWSLLAGRFATAEHGRAVAPSLRSPRALPVGDSAVHSGRSLPRSR